MEFISKRYNLLMGGVVGYSDFMHGYVSGNSFCIIFLDRQQAIF